MPPAPADIRGRVETDLADPAIQAIIDEAVQEIEDRYGPYRDPDAPISLTVEGRRRKLSLPRPVDASETVVVVEWIVADARDVEFADELDDAFIDVGQTSLTLNANDYRVWYGGRTLERLYTGTHPRVYWGSRVDLTYVPVDDTARRNEVATKLTILSLRYQGVIEERVGDVNVTYGLRSSSGGGSALVFADERERLLVSLQPRRGLMLR